jgi:hypothetical protein
MGTEQKQQSDSQDQRQGDSAGQQQRDSQDQQQYDSGQLAEKPEVTDDAKEKAKEMAKAYDDDLQTTSLPGSDGTVSGTAVTDWVDEDDKGNVETSAEEGKVEFRKTEEFRKKLEE